MIYVDASVCLLAEAWGFRVKLGKIFTRQRGKKKEKKKEKGVIKG